ncbi:MAG: hypothetical protein ACKV2O_11195 [Acidimicrobiales bacterium]
MSIERGRSWGTNTALAEGSPMVHSDADLRALVETAQRLGRPAGTVGLLGGDLCATLGGPGDPQRLRGPDAVQVPIDVVRVVLDGAVEHWFVAHLVAHRRAWAGQAAVAMNADSLGPLRLGPRAHPNDGLVDVTSGSLPWRERREARRRARTGAHLPHPALRVRRAGHVVIEFHRPTPVWLDLVPVGRARHLELTVQPDALQVVV